MYERILLTSDGSPLSAAAIPYVAAITSARQAAVIVLRVSRAAGTRAQDLSPEDWERLVGDAGRSEETVEAEPRLSEIVTRLHAHGVRRVGSIVPQGEPGPTIVEAAQRLGADLIVNASHGASGMKRAVLGSVAEHVVRHRGAAAVLMCHPLAPGFGAILGSVIVPLDGSPLADAALRHAEAIARDARSELVLVRVMDSVATVLAAETPMDTGTPVLDGPVESAEKSVAAGRAEARQQLAAVAEGLARRGLGRTRVEIVEGRPATAILEVARRYESHFIVMATHGRGGLGRASLGSVADEVTRTFESGGVLLVGS